MPDQMITMQVAVVQRTVPVSRVFPTTLSMLRLCHAVSGVIYIRESSGQTFFWQNFLVQQWMHPRNLGLLQKRRRYALLTISFWYECSRTFLLSLILYQPVIFTVCHKLLQHLYMYR